jgi:hypothetical protein
MRFDWLKRNLVAEPDSYTLFELGCFDCRALQHLPKPKQYLGADAGWEGGINDAQMNFANKPGMELIVAQSVHDLAGQAHRRFDYSIALETLEHIPTAVLKGYIEFLATVTKKKLLITVPVEVGPVFLMKHLVKRLFSGLHNGETDTYTLKEIWWAALGRADKVERFEHKGFDYRTLIKQLEPYFVITKAEGIPFRRFPYYSFQVGIVAEPIRKPEAIVIEPGK